MCSCKSEPERDGLESECLLDFTQLCKVARPSSYDGALKQDQGVSELVQLPCVHTA